MSPTTKKHVGLCAATILAALALWNCSNDIEADKANPAVQLGENASVALSLDYTDTPLLDSLVLDCYGTDTIHLVHATDEKSFKLDLFPNDDWIFKAKVYANGSLMQEGEVTTALQAGSVVNLKIPLHAIVGLVYVKIPIGFGNPAGIKKGEMKLTSDGETFTYPMVLETDNATFTSDNIKLNREYHIAISMEDASGKAIFSMEDDFLLDETSPIPSFQIESLRSKIELAIELAKDVKQQVSMTLPALKRAPTVNDLIVSEFFIVANTKDSTQFNFVEFYNGSTDTLVLDNCSFGKTSNASGSAEIGTVELPPNKVLVVGEHESADIAGIYKYAEKMPAFGKTSGSLVLQCNGTILDTLYYGKADSLHSSPLPLGSSSASIRKSTQLNISLWDKRTEGDSWCTGDPTPGSVSTCGNE